MERASERRRATPIDVHLLWPGAGRTATRIGVWAAGDAAGVNRAGGGPVAVCSCGAMSRQLAADCRRERRDPAVGRGCLGGDAGHRAAARVRAERGMRLARFVRAAGGGGLFFEEVDDEGNEPVGWIRCPPTNPADHKNIIQERLRQRRWRRTLWC